MKVMRPLLSVLLLAGTLGWSAAPVWADGVLLKVAANSQRNFCRKRFPAIREDTLSWDRPVLKDATTSDIIDFYGPCNHDPLGKEEIARQRDEFHRRGRENGTN